tara:strand:- start:22 stop:297 length:276 start_codon:yes stop_codon:yes gene_type:complete
MNLNQIEKRLQLHAEKEIIEIVENFMNEIDTKLMDKYGGASDYVHLKLDDCVYSHSIQRLESVLICMLKDRHLEPMVTVKSKELIKKLDLI